MRNNTPFIVWLLLLSISVIGGCDKKKKEENPILGITSPTYSITGYIRNEFGDVMSNAALVLSGSAVKTATTNNEGRFLFSDLPAGNYKITPSKPGFYFQPSSVEYLALASNTFSFDTFVGIFLGTGEAWANIDGSSANFPRVDCSVNGTWLYITLVKSLTNHIDIHISNPKAGQIYFANPGGIESSLDYFLDGADYSGNVQGGSYSLTLATFKGLTPGARIAGIFSGKLKTEFGDSVTIRDGQFYCHIE